VSHSLGKGVVVWVGDGVPEYPGRLSIVIGLSLTVFAVLRLVTTRADGRTYKIGLTKGGNFIGRQKQNFALKLTTGLYSKSLLPTTVVKNRQRSDSVTVAAPEFFFWES